MQKIEIKIKGIRCCGCTGRIYRALSQYDGIDKTSVDFKNSNVTVKYDKLKISANKIKDTINTTGMEILDNV